VFLRLVAKMNDEI